MPAEVELTNISNGAVQVQTINAPINLKDVNARLSVVTTGGSVTMNNVVGQKVSVETTNGNIAYTGDFSGGGTYTLMNHAGDIDVKVPANASLDLTARSVKGTVSNDFPFQKPQHPTFQAERRTARSRAHRTPALLQSNCVLSLVKSA